MCALTNKYPHYGEVVFKRFNSRMTIPAVDLGMRPALVTREPKNIQAILATNFNDYGLGSGRVALTRFLGNGIFMQDGGSWSHSRALIRPSFNRTQIADFQALESHFEELLETIHVVQDADGYLDMQGLFSDLTMDFTCEYLFGETASSLRQRREGSASVGMAYWFDRGVEHSTLSWNLGVLHFLWRPRQFRQACDFVHTYINGFVDRALDRHATGRKREDEKYVFLDALADVTQDRVTLRDQVLSVMLAGRDTTSTLLSWVVWNLARNPDVFAKLLQEVDSTLGVENAASEPDWQQLKDMKYLQAVLSETLRLFPSVAYSNRYAIKNTVLPTGGGEDESAPIFVQKGTLIMYSFYSMHRREDIYGKDSREYRPDRWLEDGIGKKMREVGWGFLPFSGGPRICLGQQFALAVASYILVRLIQKFPGGFVKKPGESDTPSFAPSLIASPGFGVWVRPMK